MSPILASPKPQTTPAKGFPLLSKEGNLVEPAICLRCHLLFPVSGFLSPVSHSVSRLPFAN